MPGARNDAAADGALGQRTAPVRAGRVRHLQLAVDVEDRVAAAVVPDFQARRPRGARSGTSVTSGGIWLPPFTVAARVRTADWLRPLRVIYHGRDLAAADGR